MYYYFYSLDMSIIIFVMIYRMKIKINKERNTFRKIRFKIGIATLSTSPQFWLGPYPKDGNNYSQSYHSLLSFNSVL